MMFGFVFQPLIEFKPKTMIIIIREILTDTTKKHAHRLFVLLNI